MTHEKMPEALRLADAVKTHEHHPRYAFYNRVAQALEDQHAEIERLRAALEAIADTDPDDGVDWFHDIANAALQSTKEQP